MKKLLSAVLLVLVVFAFAGCNRNGKGEISKEKAKGIALTKAGLTEDEVTFVRVERDRDDGKTVYEVEFYTKDNIEYDYEIDAKTGEVVSFDADAEGYLAKERTEPTVNSETPSNETQSVSGEEGITETDALKIALGEVPGATEDDARIRSDIDDGRKQYDVTIIYEKVKHEFEIDAKSGTILERDSESVYDD